MYMYIYLCVYIYIYIGLSYLLIVKCYKFLELHSTLAHSLKKNIFVMDFPFFLAMLP